MEGVRRVKGQSAKQGDATERKREWKGRGDRPPDSLRSWPGLDRGPPKVGGRNKSRCKQAGHKRTAQQDQAKDEGIGQ
eukprot:2209524-Amphidinium_carterae.3